MAHPPLPRRIEPITGLEELGLPADLITGEAVALELRPASFATRSLALALDLVLQAAVLIAALVVVGLTGQGLDPAATAAVVLTIVVGVLVGLPVTVETLTRGRSLGKLAAGLRVVRDDGGPIRFRQALVRGMIAVFEIYLTTGTVALIVSLASSQGRRLGDLLAGTYVIRDRTPGAGREAPAPMPAALAGWARGVDLGRIPDGLALAIRQFLRRVTSLHPQSRQRIGLELAARVTPFVSPGPPAGVHPEMFLTAVLAERRERDLRRLLAEEQARRAREHRRDGAPVLSPGGTALIGESDARSR